MSSEEELKKSLDPEVRGIALLLRKIFFKNGTTVFTLNGNIPEFSFE